MKFQLLLLWCLVALASGLAVGKLSQEASNLSPSFQAIRAEMIARDDDFDVCYWQTCWECESDEPCNDHTDCGGDQWCIRDFCCEHEGGFCLSDEDCYDDDDDK